jgi:hypothetical protein
MTTNEARALRAKHTCIMQASSMRCLACDRGVPYPALTDEEMDDMMGIERKPAAPRKRR